MATVNQPRLVGCAATIGRPPGPRSSTGKTLRDQFAPASCVVWKTTQGAGAPPHRVAAAGPAATKALARMPCAADMPVPLLLVRCGLVQVRPSRVETR